MEIRTYIKYHIPQKKNYVISIPKFQLISIDGTASYEYIRCTEQQVLEKKYALFFKMAFPAKPICPLVHTDEYKSTNP